MPRLTPAERETRLPSADPVDLADRREFLQMGAIVVAVHVLALAVFFIAAKFAAPPKVEQITWLDGGMMGGGESAASAPPVEPEPEPEPEPPVPAPQPPPPEPAPPPPEPTSDLAVPTAPAPATPKPETPRPSTPKPTPKPTPKATPKATPKTTPKPKPKPSATPKKPASPKPTSAPKASTSPKPATSPGAATTPKPGAGSEAPGAGQPTKAAGTGTGKGAATGEGKGKGTAGQGPGAGKPSDFGGYFSGLRDRYYAVWAPPSVPDAASLAVTLRIRVQRDGKVLAHELIKSSGNSLMDGSVLDAAQQVTQIDPLPDGLGREDIVEIPIIFKPE